MPRVSTRSCWLDRCFCRLLLSLRRPNSVLCGCPKGSSRRMREDTRWVRPHHGHVAPCGLLSEALTTPFPATGWTDRASCAFVSFVVRPTDTTGARVSSIENFAARCRSPSIVDYRTGTDMLTDPKGVSGGEMQTESNWLRLGCTWYLVEERVCPRLAQAIP